MYSLQVIEFANLKCYINLLQNTLHSRVKLPITQNLDVVFPKIVELN